MIIGNRYFWDDPEYGLYEVDETTHNRIQKMRDKINSDMHDFMVANGTPKPPIVIMGTMSDPADSGSDNDFRQLWNDSVKEKSGLIKYFQPSYKNPDNL